MANVTLADVYTALLPRRKALAALWKAVAVLCEACGGDGKRPAHWGGDRSCYFCYGTGRILRDPSGWPPGAEAGMWGKAITTILTDMVRIFGESSKDDAWVQRFHLWQSARDPAQGFNDLAARAAVFAAILATPEDGEQKEDETR